MTSKKKLKRALRFYAAEETWEIQHSANMDICNSQHCYCTQSHATFDHGDIAREALGLPDSEGAIWPASALAREEEHHGSKAT